MMPGGGAPLNVRTSPACGLVSVIVAEARLGLSLSMIRDVGVHDGDGWAAHR